MSKMDPFQVVDSAPRDNSRRFGATPSGNNGDLQMKSGSTLAASSVNDNGARVLISRPAVMRIPMRTVTDNFVFVQGTDARVRVNANGKTGTLPAAPQDGEPYEMHSFNTNANTLAGNGHNIDDGRGTIAATYNQSAGENTRVVFSADSGHWEVC
jgi:hypothetical protein